MSNALPPNVHVSSHPCARAKLSQLRSRSTNNKDAASLVHEIGLIVGSDALAHALQNVPSGTVSYPSHTPADIRLTACSDSQLTYVVYLGRFSVGL